MPFRKQDQDSTAADRSGSAYLLQRMEQNWRAAHEERTRSLAEGWTAGREAAVGDNTATELVVCTDEWSGVPLVILPDQHASTVAVRLRYDVDQQPVRVGLEVRRLDGSSVSGWDERDATSLAVSAGYVTSGELTARCEGGRPQVLWLWFRGDVDTAAVGGFAPTPGQGDVDGEWVTVVGGFGALANIPRVVFEIYDAAIAQRIARVLVGRKESNDRVQFARTLSPALWQQGREATLTIAAYQVGVLYLRSVHVEYRTTTLADTRRSFLPRQALVAYRAAALADATNRLAETRTKQVRARVDREAVGHHFRVETGTALSAGWVVLASTHYGLRTDDVQDLRCFAFAVGVDEFGGLPTTRRMRLRLVLRTVLGALLVAGADETYHVPYLRYPSHVRLDTVLRRSIYWTDEVSRWQLDGMIDRAEATLPALLPVPSVDASGLVLPIRVDLEAQLAATETTVGRLCLLSWGLVESVADFT